MINKVTFFLLSTYLMISCGQTNNTAAENIADSIKPEIIQDNRISSLKINDSIQTKDLLDTTIYFGEYPPKEIIIENLIDAPLIAEGIFLQVDSIGDTWEKIVTFQIDTMWKGKIHDKVIKFVTFYDDTLEGFKKNSHKKKMLILLNKFKKKKLYDYKDSIEYSPLRDFAIFGLDRDFRDYLLKEHKKIKK